jgi:hypothetical protein
MTVSRPEAARSTSPLSRSVSKGRRVLLSSWHSD